MCQFESAICVYVNNDLKVYTSRKSCSHSDIRKEFNLRDGGGLLDRYQTPVEYAPVDSLYGEWEFRFDAGRPEWWEDWMTEKAKRVLYKSGLAKLESFEGDLYLNTLTTLPEGVTLSPGGNLYLSKLKSLPAGVTLSPGDSLYL